MSDRYQTASGMATISTALLLESEADDVAELVAKDVGERFKSLLRKETRPKEGSPSPSEVFLDDTGVSGFTYDPLSRRHVQQLFKVSVPVNLGALDEGREREDKYVKLAEAKTKTLVQAWITGANAALASLQPKLAPLPVGECPNGHGEMYDGGQSGYFCPVVSCAYGWGGSRD